MPRFSYSIVEYRGKKSGRKCGYCKDSSGKTNHGMWAHLLTVEDYQGLINRGWRRSGQYCYKPSMDTTCCPLYGIRCQADNFKPSKSQKKVIKRMRQFLISGGQKDIDDWKALCERKEAAASAQNNNAAADDDDDNEDKYESADEEIFSGNESASEIQSTSKTEPRTSGSNKDEKPAEVAQPDPTASAVTPKNAPQRTEPKPSPKKGEGPDPNKPKAKKAKQIRLERKREKMLKKGVEPPETFEKKKPAKQEQERTLEDLLPHLNPPENAKHKLEVRLVQSRPRSDEFEKTRKESYAVYRKYQLAIHKDDPNDCEEKQWMRFLVDSPLTYDDKPFKPGFGSFHNQYWLDDKLIAVGVCDVLPNYISSVYLYYDPDYGFLTMGVYSALSEIVMTRKIHELRPSIEYYCMGYYVQSCQKMRYKNKFFGTEVLCPETYRWIPLYKCIEALKKSKYTRLNELGGGSPDDKDEDGEWDSLESLGVLHRRSPSTYGAYQRHKYESDRTRYRLPDGQGTLEEKRAREDERMRTYAKMVGKTCGRRILVFRSDDEDYY